MRKRAFGTHEIARICHVTPPTIGRWIEEGKLPSFKTGGGHRRVWDEDLVIFLKEHNIPIPDALRGGASLKILVVDDEAEMRRFILRVVRKISPDAELQEAADGFEAGHRIATDPPSLVILDLLLPGMDGFKVCQIVRADARLSHIRILAITGFGVDESRRRVMSIGADDFLAKPFNADELTSKVEKMLSVIKTKNSRTK